MARAQPVGRPAKRTSETSTTNRKQGTSRPRSRLKLYVVSHWKKNLLRDPTSGGRIPRTSEALDKFVTSFNPVPYGDGVEAGNRKPEVAKKNSLPSGKVIKEHAVMHPCTQLSVTSTITRYPSTRQSPCQAHHSGKPRKRSTNQQTAVSSQSLIPHVRNRVWNTHPRRK